MSDFNPKEFRVLVSDINSGPQSIPMDKRITNNIDFFVGYTFVDVDDVPIPVGNASGIFTISATTNVNPTASENFYNNDGVDLDASVAPKTLSTSSNIQSVEITQSVPLAGADAIILRVYANSGGYV